MKEKLFGTSKRKAGAIAVICTAMALTLGASTVFAASGDTQGVNNGPVKTATAGALKIQTGEIPDGIRVSLAVRVENGVTLYSTDGGKTWSETVPDGYNVDIAPDGRVTVGKGILPADAGKGVMVKMDEDGQASYSTDGGETWNNGLPEGAQAVPLEIRDGEIPAGAKMIKSGEASTGIIGGFAVKIENGVTLYSTDAGKTWSETVPGGYSVDAAADGRVTVRAAK